MRRRWPALAIIFGSFIQFTLNWFAIIPMFHGLITDLHLLPVQLGGVISAFIAGYGVLHLPGGMLAERIGMRRALLAGIAIESLGALWSGMTDSYGLLLAARFLCGAGGSIYIGSAVGLTTAWFRDRYLATANGLITGVAFSLGAAIGLFGWGLLGAWIGWRMAIVAGSGLGFLTLLVMATVYPEPPAHGDDRGTGPQHSLASLRRVLGNGTLWMMGLAFAGGYGSYFAATALLPGFAETGRGASPAYAEALSAIMLLSGIVGAFAGGWLADKVLGLLPTFLLGCVVEAAALLSVPFLRLDQLWIAAGMIGAGTILSFVTWIGLPGVMPDRLRTIDVPSAVGLMLTIVAVGGVLIPPFYVTLASRYGAGTAWSAEALLSIGLALIALLGRRTVGAVPIVRSIRVSMN